MIDISQNGKWHVPKWKVAYTKMEIGMYHNRKWHIQKWKVAYTTDHMDKNMQFGT
jgi:hypothetical protein